MTLTSRTLAVLLLGSATALATQAAAPTTVAIKDAKGADVGTAKLSADPKGHGVAIALDLHGLAPGVHAIHIHETAKCDGPDFKSAGGHFNPEHKHHGLDSKEGPHAGDIPNFTVDAKGNAKVTIVAANATLDDGPHSVFTGGGTALVIHAKADDMKSDPAGNAGDRIACGVIVPGAK
jgi:Cu-Zn family superoxide dismutase